MARIDLNRFRKIYPSRKKQPHFFNQTNEVKAYTIAFSNSKIETIPIGTWNYPVIVIGQTDNVNIWVSKVYREVISGPWRIDISASSSFTGEVHIHVAEGNP